MAEKILPEEGAGSPAVSVSVDLYFGDQSVQYFHGFIFEEDGRVTVDETVQAVEEESHVWVEGFEDNTQAFSVDESDIINTCEWALWAEVIYLN